MDVELLITFIYIFVGFVIMPYYSAWIIERKIKKYTKKFKLEELTEQITKTTVKVMEGLQNAGLIEGEKDG